MFALSENIYFISSLYIFVESFGLKQIKKTSDRKKLTNSEYEQKMF